MELLASNLLVPNATLIVQVLAFLLTLGVLAKWILPPLDRAVKKRQAQIESSLNVADEAKREAEETRRLRDGILDEARREARELAIQASRTAEQLKASGERRGQEEFERIVANAQTEIARERARLTEELSGRVGELAMSLAARVVAREVDPALHQDLVAEAVEAFRARSSSGAQTPATSSSSS